MDKQLVSVSKFLSLVLRHQPERIGLQLDDQGWADVDQLLALAAQAGRAFDRALLEEVVRANDKQRFTFDDSGQRIRANQGHSVQVDLQLAPQTPPALLYHGTVDRFLESIRAQGVLRGSRQHVHLSPDTNTAVQVGARRGKPVILAIQAESMHSAGHTFYRSQNGVWLTDHVPPQFIDFPE